MRGLFFGLIADDAAHAARRAKVKPDDLARQRARFGARTLANAGGFRPRDEAGNFVTLEKVDSGAAEAGGGWTVHDGALVCETTPPVTADGATLICALNTGGTVEIELGIDDGPVYSVISGPELQSALDVAYEERETDHVITLRDGSVIEEPDGAIELNLNEKTNFNRLNFLGSVTWSGAGRTVAEIDPMATPSYSGGSVTIRPETPLGAEIRAPIIATRACGLVFDGVRFTHTGQRDNIERRVTYQGLGEPNVSFATKKSDPDYYPIAQVDLDALDSDKPWAVFMNCQFGAYGVEYDDGGAVRCGHWMRGLSASVVDIYVFDCVFRDFMEGVSSIPRNRCVLARNLFRNKTQDCLKVGPSNTRTNPAEFQIFGNVDVDLCIDDGTQGIHSDFGQKGTGIDTRPIIWRVFGNYIDSRSVPVTGYTPEGGSPAVRSGQGLFNRARSAAATESGEIKNNLFIISAVWGLSVNNASDLTIRCNTVIRDETNRDAIRLIQGYDVTPVISIREAADMDEDGAPDWEHSNAVLSDNIGCSVQPNAVANVLVERNAEVADWSDFQIEGEDWSYPEDASRQQIIDMLDARFTPKPGSPIAGLGHTSSAS